MISIIICSRNIDISPELKENIATTIGCEYELIVIDNSTTKYSIFQAYNEGVLCAKGSVLCFMHDDVMFCTEDLGKIVEMHFEVDDHLGMMGFAGAHFMPSMPMYWHDSPFISENNLTTRKGQTEECFSREFFGDKTLVEVAAVDGLCFFVRADLFKKISFDEKTFTGFHMYDMDISFQVREAGFKVCVCKDVLVEHFYDFNPSPKGLELFENNMKKFYKKWSSCFPLVIGLEGVSDGMIVQLDSYVKRFLQQDESLQNIRKSKAYRLGKTILKPIKMLKR